MSNWTLFLDRDGVINEEPPVEQIYVNYFHQFHFYPDTLKALQIVNSLFETIVIATNQRGVFRGLTPLSELQHIHAHLLEEAQKAGGSIDKIYYSADGDADHPNRKPNSGMAHLAQKDFPQIDFKRSIMIGNNPSDMQFGRNVGMTTIFLTTTMRIEKVKVGLYDYHFSSLYEAAVFLKENLAGF